MKFQGRPQEARLIRRLNRFAVLVEVAGRVEMAHLPNSGRLQELLNPGRRALLLERPGPGRKTGYDLTLVWLEGLPFRAVQGRPLSKAKGFWACADARIPPSVVAEALAQGALPPFARFRRFTREVAYGDSRLDLALEAEGERCLMEVKSVTLVEGGRALFPDAPTLRGTRHLRELTKARGQGLGAAVIFIIQRPDATLFSPNDAADPLFGQALRQAAAAGVEVHAYKCRVTPEEICLDCPVPVDI